MANALTNATTYAKITGIVLAAVALLGIIMNLATTTGELVPGFLTFDWTHNVLHVALAAVALYVGFMASGNLVSNYAKIFGIVYTLLAIVGFIPGMATLGPIHLEMGENLVHLLIGLWGITAGFFGTKETAGVATPTTPTKPKGA